jgi:hypothetical protein
MDKKIFKKIYRGPNKKYCSFAIWDENDLTKEDIIAENLNELRNDIVFVGLNAVSQLRPFGNFHGRESGKIGRGGKDRRLMEAFNNSKFRGAYMTDLFKHSKAISQNKLDISEKDKKRAFENFSKELKLLKAINPRIIVFGDKVYCYIMEWANKSNFRGRIDKLPHFSIWKKAVFMNAAKRLE